MTQINNFNQILLSFSIIASGFLGSTAWASPKVGAAAPDFTIQDAAGVTHNLKDYKDKWVVLEWYNKDCPYVRKHYDSGNMQKTQAKALENGAVWLTVISSAKGKQGYLEPKEALSNAKEEKSKATAILLDPKGKVGKTYDAKTTPHMYIINPKGQLAYAGAIDDNPSANPKVIPDSTNYVINALESGVAKKSIASTTSTPYGCSIKY